MPAVRPRGPWFHRFLIYVFTVLLALLVYWTLGFLVDDAGEISPPDIRAIEHKEIPADVKLKADQLRVEADGLRQRSSHVREQQSLLREGTDNYERTMRQMAELERLRLQQDEAPSEDQQQALAQAVKQFLNNQREYQAKTEEIVQLAKDEERIRQELIPLDVALESANQRANAIFAKTYEEWQWRAAAIKVGMLIPLILLAGWLFRNYRSSIYWPLVHGFGIAVGAKVIVVTHTYFPAVYFKYLLIGTSLLATIWLLVKLVRMIARPHKAWLLKQYREAYEAFLCPVCDFPIRRGPLKYLSWTRRTIKRLPLPTTTSGSEPETPYTCPLCATHLYEECAHCHGIRPSLLPACTHCGEVKAIEQTQRPAAAE